MGAGEVSCVSMDEDGGLAFLERNEIYVESSYG